MKEEDVEIVNERGNKVQTRFSRLPVASDFIYFVKVYYIRAPGNYSLRFKKIKVEKDFGFLAGEIGVTLQVPIIEGPAGNRSAFLLRDRHCGWDSGIRFDYPYTMVPETGLLYQQCDAHSGIIERNGRQFWWVRWESGRRDRSEGDRGRTEQFCITSYSFTSSRASSHSLLVRYTNSLERDEILSTQFYTLHYHRKW